MRSYIDTALLLLRFLEGYGLPTDVTLITREHVELFLDDQLRRWRPATAAVRYRSLRQLFGWLVGDQRIAVSPMERMGAPKVPEEPVTVVHDDDLRRLLATCGSGRFEDVRDAALLRLMIETGVRLSEAAGIKIDDLDLSNRCIEVLGKGRRRRTVPIGARTCEALRIYLAVRGGHRQSFGPGLWLSVKGTLTTSGITQMLRRRCARAGIGSIHPHQFRHTAAHDWRAAGGSEGDAMRLFGWRSRDMLSRYGAVLADQRARASFERLAPGDRF